MAINKHTHSAAVCEFSDACEMLLERGFDCETLEDWESAMAAERASQWVQTKGMQPGRSEDRTARR